MKDTLAPSPSSKFYKLRVNELNLCCSEDVSNPVVVLIQRYVSL